MDQLIVNASIVLISCLISAGFTFWALRKNNEIASEAVKTEVSSILEAVQARLDSEFEQFLPLIKRSMTLAANAGAQVKKVQAFEKEAIKAIQDDLPITPDMVRAFSPKLGEMIDENPELLFKGRKILQKILGNPGQNVSFRSTRTEFRRRLEE